MTEPPQQPHRTINVDAIPSVSNVPVHYVWNPDGTPRQLIRDVWASNLEEEFKNIRNLVDEYPCIAMDTEFPGVVLRVGRTANPNEYQYQNLRSNVNILKMIQLGLTFSDHEGNLPPTGASTWQFNFRFSLHEDSFAEDSIQLLQQSGIDFTAFEERGVDPHLFAELMLTSGLVLSEEATWLSFHSGFDFGYLIRMLTGRDLPESETEFHELLATIFHRVVDTKYLLRHTSISHNAGLSSLADDLRVQRIGPPHQAGSDSLLTWATYFKLVHDHFGSQLDFANFANVLYGLGKDATAAPHALLASLGPHTAVCAQARNVPPSATGGTLSPLTGTPGTHRLDGPSSFSSNSHVATKPRGTSGDVPVASSGRAYLHTEASRAAITEAPTRIGHPIGR
eukprot:TRINITY_DN2856_c0_g1_i1.p1 TRINITY_DN2856_c0_g1~~TRINITY_DN2856_c0_g1_i1.p1  ORF type:complete len:395 (-),score=39.59 TRINITY_DN2856_c0_g1_i1:1509-2693(-)